MCGLGLTPRPTYDSTLGNDQFPGEYRVFAFDEDPGNPAAEASFADWKTKVAAGEWEGGTEVAHGTDLQYGNKEQYVTFPATTKRVFALTGLRSLAPGKKDMALSDIKLLPCDAESNAITCLRQRRHRKQQQCRAPRRTPPRCPSLRIGCVRPGR